MNELTLDMEVAYKELRPHLLDALAKLARQGFVISPWDGLDLIHDFFVEAWEGINERYDAAKGSFNAYAYGAFVHFARPRIVKLQRLQNSLVEPEQLEYLHNKEVDEEEETYVPPEETKQIVREAISHLPLREREILSRYLYSKPRAERMLARRFSLSRYSLRQVLIDAIGQVMVRVNKPQGMGERDWNVALALWRDKRTIDETAGYLGLTTYQVRESNSRNVQLLAEALKYYHPNRMGHPRRSRMKPQQNLIPPHDLLEKVLKSPGNQELLKRVREQAEEVLAALENSESFGLSEDEIRELDPLWVAEVYQAMSAATSEEIHLSEAAEMLFHAQQNEETAIGAAFRETLMPDLPEYLQNIGKWLSAAPQVDSEEMHELMREPSVRAGMPYSEQLIPYGVTPLTVFYATEAVSSLLDRLMRYELISTDTAVLMDMNWIKTEGYGNDLLNLSLLVDEIGKVSESNEYVARALYAWTVQVAQYKPFLFSGFQASPMQEGVYLVRTEEVYDNMFQRWGLRMAVAIN